MCGIAGVYAPDERRAQAAVAAMTRQLEHRGPDDGGIETIRTVAGQVLVLGFRRLAIIDLSPAGHQPMHDPVTGNWLVFNGEIYNFRELRAELNQLGETDWRSATDTEVILKAYRRLGERCVERLSGMFAFALWDSNRQRLLLARDRLGIKPLYYAQVSNALVFASEVRALLTSGLVAPDPCLEAVDSYLELGAVQDPLTIVQGVRSVEAGSIMTADPNAFGKRHYWDLALAQGGAEDVTEPAAVARVHELLQTAVARHLIADVPLGVFLSGGMDSSALVVLSRMVGQEQVRTVSVVFDEPECSEEVYSRLVAKTFGTDHTELRLSATDLRDDVEPALAAADQPTVDGVNTYIVAQAARHEGLKVVLSGLGGDEIFAGYASFRWGPRLKRFQHLNPLIRRPLAEAVGWIGARNDGWAKVADWLSGNAGGHPYFLMRQLFGPAAREELIGHCTNGRGGTFEPTLNGQHDPVNEIARFELSYYMRNMLLRDSDAMSMAHGLELRVPMLDDALVEYVVKLPGRFKLAHGQLKPLLAKALSREIPPEIAGRSKSGFTLPFQFWLNGPLCREVEEVLLDREIGGPLREYLSMPAIERIWRRFRSGRGHWSRPWALYSLKKWAELNLRASAR